MSGRFIRPGLLVLAAAAVAVLLPAAGQSKLPPEHDGSGYTWVGAVGMTVDVLPWGGGYVRSDPYLIDCPMACVRPFELNRDVKLTAYATPGHTFKAWEGACAGQGNPCTLKVSGAAMEVTAVFTGQFVPPAPPPPPPAPPPPAELDPQLEVGEASGACPPCFRTYSGTGFNPNSTISLTIAYSNPAGYDDDVPDVATTNAEGAWSRDGIGESCDGFEGLGEDGVHHGEIVRTVTATDEQGASASEVVIDTCP